MSVKGRDDDTGPEMDDTDTAFVNSIVPDGGFATGFIAVVTWVDSEGAACWRVYNQLTSSISADIGMLEMAKLELIARTDTGLPFRYANNEDD